MATHEIIICRRDFRSPHTAEGIDFFEDILASLGIPEDQRANIDQVDVGGILDTDVEIS